MQLRDVDWIPAGRFWRAGKWHYTRPYATFKSNAGSFRVELLTPNQVLVKGQNAGLGIQQMDMLRLTCLLHDTDAKQNPRRGPRKKRTSDDEA